MLLFIPLAASAQELTLISESDSIPSVLDRVIKNHRYIKSHINLEFVSSANAKCYILL